MLLLLGGRVMSKYLVRTLRWIFLFLSIFGIRQWLARAMPQSLVLAVGSGIGLFIAYVIYFLYGQSRLLISNRPHYQIHWAVYVCLLSDAQPLTNEFEIASSGLGVVGGDTTNYVGLGGCKAEGLY